MGSGFLMVQPIRIFSIVVLVFALLAPATPAVAAPGDLDPTFGGDGKVTTDFTRDFDSANDLAIQADGKIVAAGRSAGGGGMFALARYDPDGTLDTTFGGDGEVTTNFTSGDDWAAGVAIQSNGKIVAAGRSAAGGGKFALVRYDTDGTLDNTFGGDGKITTNLTVGEDDRASGVAIQSNGKIVAAGTAFLNCDCSSFALVRYEPDGTLDGTFGGDGKVTTDFKGGGEANSVAIQPDGKIVTAGGHPDVNRFEVARYNPNGTLDATFGGNGKTTTNMGEGEEAASSVAIQANGKVVVAGYTDVPYEEGDLGPGKFALARYRVGGTLDPRFSGDGRLTTRFDSETAYAFGMAILADRKIVAAGRGVNRGGRFVLSRYEPDGTLDTTFGGDGRVTLNFTAEEDGANAVVIQADGNIVAAGVAGGSGGRFALARFLGS